MKAVAVTLTVAWSLAASPSLGSSVTSTRFEHPRDGYGLRLPAGWRASVRQVDDVMVITSLPVPNRNDNPERIQLPRGGVYIWIAEYRGVRPSGIPRRPARIQLGEKRAHACGFGEGYMLHFTDRGRLLQVFVKLGPVTDTSRALGVLDSLRVT
jgi:hypothetical protein